MDTPASHTSPTARAKNRHSTLRDHWFAGASLLERRDFEPPVLFAPLSFGTVRFAPGFSAFIPKHQSAKSSPGQFLSKRGAEKRPDFSPFRGSKRAKRDRRFESLRSPKD
jgi:hypothetical protein